MGRPQLTLIADQLLIKLPKTKIPTELKFPKGATSCIRKLMLTFYSPATGYYYANHLQLEPILNIKGTIDAQEFDFTVPKGVICFLSMALEYHTESYGVSKVINNKQFNPAGICEVLINPGIFDIENPELQPQLRYWENDSKILLPGAVFLTEEEGVANKDVQLAAKSKEAKPAKEKKADKQNEKEIRKAEAKSIAATLKNMGMDTAEIVKATGLSKKQVEEL
ncbi:hypothetical protein LPB86_10740 [Pedobacter sp. MC2016-14]|uniref:hypothetical protein n=1 Tax=Pedobacter sp. MC2016-14 TaxID=2897327 RepID=UPI001E2E7823|nr:hypothetical protein [Pedobacter sp. MC2016-14]MCD0488711.1 hypothetical protein [Pedobacter sp. MC2016-14]